ncbi:hypothetical protein MHK74_08725 [Microbacterium aurum]|uniref:hypothetical protein n=1 Tax=Microbacterium aurum TaxID=36805 RepID=UPI001EF54309|nr:hypothetical protein [Microbacterium aurum]MCG7414648.1 hypothetical protein [Microbacterium aurum]
MNLELDDGRHSDDIRRMLVDAGFLVGQMGPGVTVWSERFEQLARKLQESVGARLESTVDREIWAPPVVDTHTATASGYLDNFPQLAGIVSTAQDGTPEYMRAALVGAACHPFFAVCAPQHDEPSRTVGRVTAPVFRWEPDDDPFRLVSFRQTEHVIVAGEGEVRSVLAKWTTRILNLLRDDLGLPISLAAANDPFFGRVGQLKGDLQLASGDKTEALLITPHTSAPVALASVNYHGSRLVRAFEWPGDTVSGCLGVGLERTAIAVLLTHGPSEADWPETVKELLAHG